MHLKRLINHFKKCMQDCSRSACHLSHMQREALVVVFQCWFTVAAEEASVASELAVYLRVVRKSTPSLLAFLVNLADDNGNTVLHYSVSHCNYSIVSLLLETGDCFFLLLLLLLTADKPK